MTVWTSSKTPGSNTRWSSNPLTLPQYKLPEEVSSSAPLSRSLLMKFLFLTHGFSCTKFQSYSGQIVLPDHVSAKADDEPVEDLKEGDEAETKAKSKQAAHA